MNLTKTMVLFASVLMTLLYNFGGVNSANCASLTSESSCESEAGCAWSSSDSCYCTSNVTMDICFALDASGSIGSTSFSLMIDWLSDYVESSLSASARVGLIEFSDTSQMILNFSDSQTMTTSAVADFIDDISYWRGYTNTVAAIKQGIRMFEKESYDQVTKVFVIFTDGNPYLPGGDTDVCAWASTLKADNINTYILGVGDNWNPDNVDCLVDDSSTDIIYVDSFSYSDFDAILPQLSDITCPVSYEAVITEVKVESGGEDYGAPFIEIYNPSNDIPLTDLEFEGVVNGAIVGSSDTRVLSQGSYLVLYDATYSSGLASNVSCEECGCTKQGNSEFCSGQIYIGCDDSYCSFPSSSYSNGNWYLKVLDTSTSTSQTLDTVTWGSTFPDLTNLVGFSYELKNKGFNNDDGSNWQQSCNIYGSPGYEPLTDCDSTCIIAQCTSGGASENDVEVDGDECDCDGATHYYADGCTCNLVPPPSNCYMYWRKNGTVRDYKFIWDEADTDDDKQYRLTYFASSSGGSGWQSVTLYPRLKVVSDYDSSRAITTTPGYVQTYMYDTYSVRVNCTSITMDPTTSPTDSPTGMPTPAPTSEPTPSPTFENPYLYLAGDICEQTRCDCNGASRSCTGDEISVKWSEGSTEFVTVEQRPVDFPYTTLVYWDISYMGETTLEDADNITSSSRRRLLTKEEALINVMKNKYGVDMDISDLSLVSRKEDSRRMQSVFATTSSNNNLGEFSTTGEPDPSTDISPTSGYVNISISEVDSTNEGKIELEILSDGTETDSLYEMFVLTLRNCSVYSTQYEECDLVYPYELYIILEDKDSSLTVNTKEEEMPAWLWWVIVALVIFLFVLGWLVYRYWWKNKETNSALAETQDELDQAIEEADLGFGRDLGQGDVGFNPLATGVPGSSRPTDQMGAELANRQNMFGNDKADVAVERFNQKEQFGQVAPHRREKGGNDLSQPFL